MKHFALSRFWQHYRQLPLANWYNVIGENTITDAILDRLIHSTHCIELTGAKHEKKTVTLTEPLS